MTAIMRAVCAETVMTIARFPLYLFVFHIRINKNSPQEYVHLHRFHQLCDVNTKVYIRLIY